MIYKMNPQILVWKLLHPSHRPSLLYGQNFMWSYQLVVDSYSVKSLGIGKQIAAIVTEGICFTLADELFQGE